MYGLDFHKFNCLSRQECKGMNFLLHLHKLFKQSLYMEENMTKKKMWNDAGKAGLALGAVSAVYLFATQFMGKAEMSNSATIFLTGILWIAKFGGCIWLMMFFMKRYVADNPEVSVKETRRFGTVIALLSALAYSAISFANAAFISADMLNEQMNIMLQQMAPMLDANTMAQMDETMQNLPQITFFTNLIYCFIYGAILSAILSAKIINKDPFADYQPEEE